MRNAARPVGHFTIEKMLARGNKLKDYVEKPAKAKRLGKELKISFPLHFVVGYLGLLAI